MQGSGARPGAARFACGLALLLVGCAGEPQAMAWERTDLCAQPPRVIRGPARAARAILGFQGPDEVRDLTRLNPRQLAAVPVLRASRVQVVRQQPDTVVSWTLALGGSPHLAFTPLAVERGCGPARQVSVGEPGAGQVAVWNAPPGAVAAPPAEVVLPLDRWERRTVELRLRLGAASCAADWGSPEVVSRERPRLPRLRRKGKPPNVILVGADTLRADAVGAWGRRPSLTPALDALAAESDVWLRAYSAANSTTSSFASILTGLHVPRHGVVSLDTPLPPAHTTLAERFSEAGYESLAVLAAQHIGPRRSGLGQGFDHVIEAENTSSARLVVNQAMAWLERERDAPFFVWLHLFDPHTPHTPPAPFALGMRAAEPYGLGRVLSWAPFRALGPRTFTQPLLGGQRDLYDGEVAYLDRELDRLLGYLRDRGLLADTVVAFVSDHGENLGEHGVDFRHAGLWETTTHVPLMIRWPGERRTGRRFEGLVQSLDLYPTLLAAAGLRPNPQDGLDLRTLTADGRLGRRAVFSAQIDGTGAAVRTRRARLFSSRGSRIVREGDYLYDLDADPGERVNLAGAGRPEEGALRELLRRWLAHGTAPAPRGPADAAIEAELRALGYL